MAINLEESLIVWTARLMVLCYLLRCWLDWRIQPDEKREQTRNQCRRLWTCGLLLYLSHVVAAFLFIHNMSHQQAYQHTAERTTQVVGLNWGGGIYVNHLFLIFWLVDTILWWSQGVDYPYQSKLYYLCLQTIFAFMFVNATVIFGPQHWQVIAICLVVTVILTGVFRKRTQKTDASTERHLS